MKDRANWLPVGNGFERCHGTFAGRLSAIRLNLSRERRDYRRYQEAQRGTAFHRLPLELWK